MSQQINLFNPLFRKQKKYFSAATMLQALSLIFLGSLLVYGYAWYRMSTINQRAGQTATTHKATQAKLLEISAQSGPRQPSQLLTDEVARMEAKLQARRHIVGLLGTGELGNSEGFSEFFRALSRQTMNGVWITSFHVSGAQSDVAISGRALQPELVPVFLNRLKTETILAGKSFSTMEMRLPAAETAADGKPQPGYRFIEFSLRKAEPGTAQ
ncbi:MAG: PilN domain-containing protein [Arenimonas sp.]